MRPDCDPGRNPGLLKLWGARWARAPTLRPIALWGRLWWQLLLTDASTSCGIKHRALGVGVSHKSALTVAQE